MGSNWAAHALHIDVAPGSQVSLDDCTFSRNGVSQPVSQSQVVRGHAPQGLSWPMRPTAPRKAHRQL